MEEVEIIDPLTAKWQEVYKGAKEYVEERAEELRHSLEVEVSINRYIMEFAGKELKRLKGGVKNGESID